MEFLQRHLPRVYQAVQNALEYLTNVTAQIFGAPPNAPQPRNAPVKTPLKFEDTAAPAKQEEICESQGADHMTLAADVSLEDAALEATEESMKKYGTQQDVENQGHETQIRHRKESVDRRLLDLHHTIGDGKDAFIHHQVTVDKHKDQSHNEVITDDAKLTKPDDVDDILSSVTREVLHFEVHTVTNEEVQKIKQEALVYEKHTRNKTEEKSSTLIEDLLRDLEPKSYQEHEVLPTSNELLKSNLNLDNKENSCSSSNVNNSPSLEKTIISHEVSEGACHVIITSEEVDQESPGDFSAPPVIMENDDLDVSDIKGQHKKLVTPVSAADSSPRDQREEAKKTWEHLQETAVRLALHCDLLQDDDQKSEMLGYGEISKTTHVNEMHLSRPDEQGDGGEHLEKTSHDRNEVQELNSEEEERSEEISGFSKSKEGNQYDEQNQNIEKMRKRVRFSPSTEERDLMINLTSEDTVSIKVDLTQDGALQPTTEYSDQPPNSHPRPEADDKQHDFGLINNSEDIEPSMMDPTTEEDRVNALYMGHTVWYEELKITTDKEMCESICPRMTSSCQPEETIAAITDKESAKKPSTDVPSVERQDCEEEPFKNLMSTPHGLLTHSGVDIEMAYDHEEGTCSFNKVADGPLEKSPAVISDLWKQDGSNTADNEDISVSVEVISQSSEEITDIESLKQQVHGEGDNEYTESREKLFGLRLHPLMEETKDSTNGGLTLMTDELNFHESVSRPQGGLEGPNKTTAVMYTPDESYNQTSVQELDISKNEQGDMISIESKRRLSRDISNIDKVQTAEDPAAGKDNERSVGRNLPLKTETQKEEDKAGMEYEDEKDIKVELQELEDHTWHTQNSYQSDDLITYSDSNNMLESPKDQNPLEKIDELSEQLPDKGSESEVMSKDGETEQTNLQLGGSNEDSAKVNYLYIAPQAKPRNISLLYPGDSLGSDNELEDIYRPSETGFDLLSEIQSMISRGQSEQDISEVTGRSDVTHGAVSSGDMEMESTESGFLGEINFQTDNVAKDLDLQGMLMPGQPVNKIPEDLAEDNQNSVPPDEALQDESIDGVQEKEIHLDTRSLVEDNIEVILDQHSEVDSFSEPQDRSDLLSELHSVMSVNHSVMSLDHEILGMMSTMNAGESDKVVEDVSHSNEEKQAQILSAKPTVEENENLEVHSPGLQLSEELGSLIEPKQIPEEEHYSSIETAVTESTTRISDVGLDINNTSVEISENKEQEDDRAEEDTSSVTLDEITNGYLRAQSLHIDKEQEPPLDTESSAEDNIEDILEQNVEVDNVSEPQHGCDLLSEPHPMLSVGDSVMSVDHKVLGIMSTVNVVQLDKGMYGVGQSNEENIAGILSAKITIEENENLDVHSPGLHLSEEFGSLIEPKQIPEEEHYFSIETAVTESITNVSDIGLNINNTSVEISENKAQEDDQTVEDTSSFTLDEITNEYLRDQSPHLDKKQEPPLDTGSSVEDNIKDILEYNVEVDNFSEPQYGSDLLSEPHPMLSVGDSVMSVDHKVLRNMSTVNVVQLDKGMHGVGQSNEENIAGILSTKITVEENENLEVHSPGLHLSEELGSLIEPKQIPEEEHYSSIEIVTESTTEVSDVGLDINNISVEISENKDQEDDREEDKCSVTLDDTPSGHLGDQPQDNVNELDILLDTGSFAEEHIEVIVEPVSHSSGFSHYFGTLEGGGDLLSNMGPSVEVIVSTMNVDQSDKRKEDGGHSNDEAIFEHHEDPEEDHPHMCLVEELIKPEHTFDEYHYSSIVVTETPEEASNINYDSKKTESVLMKKPDPSIDTHHDHIQDCTVENISENKDEAVESQSFETLDDTSRRQFRDLEVNEPVIPLENGSLIKDIGVILGFTSESSQGEGDLLSDIHSVETIDHPTEVISLFSTTGEEDILETSKAWDILHESAIQVDTLADTIIPDEQEKIQNSISTISCPEVIGPSLELSQELEENQRNSSSLDNHEPEKMDLLSEIRSVVTTDYSMEFTTITSTVKVITSDEASGDIFSTFIKTDGKEGSEEAAQELCHSQSKEEVKKKIHDEQDSSSTTVTIGTEYSTDFDINKSSETSEYFGLSGLKISLLPSIDPTQQEGMEGENEEQLSSDEALYLGQKKQVITIHTEEPLQVIEPPIHVEMCEDQRPPVVGHKGTLMEPSAEEEDDIDSSLLPLNTLDVSAQKSRVQLRRKTSIRRKQGQRQVTSESEHLEPTQPVIRSQPIGKMPIFKMAPNMAPIVSHPAEEQKEEKPAEEDLLVKPKKGIPRHAGFGIPHPQMMQELQARLKKKKPNE